MKNVVKLLYFINDQQSSIMLDLSNKISVLKYIIGQSQNIRIDDYNIYYSKKLINEKDDKFLYEIIGKDNKPILFFRKKSKYIIIKYNIDLNYPIIFDNSNSNNSPLNKIKTKSISNDQLAYMIQNKNKNSSTDNTFCKLILTHYPSKNEIFSFLEKFLEERKFKKSYQAEIIGSSLQFVFSDSEITYRFFKYLNVLKISNGLYNKLQIKLVSDNKLQFGNKLSKSIDPKKSMPTEPKLQKSLQIKRNTNM
jgi:hypothetical protein